MQICKWCLDSKPEEDFYSSRKDVCKVCIRAYNHRYFSTVPDFPRAKTYADYLKGANLTDYAQRYLKHFT